MDIRNIIIKPSFVKLERLLSAQLQQFAERADVDIKYNKLKIIRKNSNGKKHCCVFCYKFYVSLSVLRNHMFVHTRERPFSCKICNNSYRTRANRKRHHKIIHSESKPYSCSRCQLAFKRKRLLSVHLRTFHENSLENKTFECAVCKKTFHQWQNLIQHTKTHTNEKPFKCVICEHSSRTLPHLMMHIAVKHVREKLFSCAKCTKSFALETDLKSHVFRTHQRDDWGFSCSVCEKKFPCNSALKKHMRVRTGERSFSCKVCGAQFTRKCSLKGHTRVHLKVYSNEKGFASSITSKYHKVRHEVGIARPYKCKECHKTFLIERHLKSHVDEVHRKLRPFSCELCQKTFARPWSRNIHLETHLNEKPMKCETCGKRFTPKGYQAHVKCHNILTDISCSACSKRFISRVEMLRHYLKVHVGSMDNILVCLFCNEKCDGLLDLERHVKKHTRERHHFCIHCDNSFSSQLCMDRHQKRYHT